MAEEKYNLPVSKLPLVEKNTPNDFRSSFHWRVFRIMAEFVDGWQFLADYKKMVTFFGSARFPEDTRWYKEAQTLGRLLAEAEFDVVTGGGPGIMEAGNRGAHEAHKHSASLIEHGGDSIGLNIKLPFEQRINRYVDKAVAFHYFFVRKVMLSYYAQAYVFFPGGFGTLDEWSEILTLVQTKKVPSTIPIVMVGKEFWTPLADWINTHLHEKFKTIDKEDMNLYSIVDTAEEAFEIIKKAPERKEF
ncbi:MAG: Rossman fold protein, TIGR00730 family [Candidatus Yanofskybacteria bacterium RIFCSPLOWO2_01_FULL_49_25]|uniref:Cytokinin riboside 5'-monophosphate phosphoribohydrolase n=1 Tax=Candidatus Yanofskybacteria bacterium RIFCSPLOWO2_01_FULL_49_25 TaxID=1802701 RepID=A0A1F8GYU6_9BACT|nr:MAG: Rossman fold protein, TIGR00730 family [Candidatus Yanofskybacteria bacterium RIFCSPLOWO2_01_FULL_49_25]